MDALKYQIDPMGHRETIPTELAESAEPTGPCHNNCYRTHNMEVYNVEADTGSLYVYRDGKLQVKYEVEAMRSLLWDDCKDHLVILANHGRRIDVYTFDKNTFAVGQDTVLAVGYEIENFYAVWSRSTLLIQDAARRMLNVYNVDKRQDMGYITLDCENSDVLIIDDRIVQLVATYYDKQLKTLSRYCNSYEFEPSGRLVLRTSVPLPPGYHRYTPVAVSEGTSQVYCVVMNTLGQDKHAVYFLLEGSVVPYKSITGKGVVTSAWIDTQSETLYIEKNLSPRRLHISLFQDAL